MLKWCMNYTVIKPHISEFPNPIELVKGENVSIGEDPDPTNNPETWVNWLYCVKEDSSNAGFVPKQIIQREDKQGTVLEDYTAKELTVEKGELIEYIKTLNGWLWGKRVKTGELGWIPLENVQVFYCDVITDMKEGSKKLHKEYHDNHYGFPIHNDNELFGRLILEINQAGLSWETVLRKQHNFRKAFDNYDIKKIASYGEDDRARLLADAGIIRNRLKVDSVIHNANVVLGLQKEFGSFEKWLDAHHPRTKEEWVKLFKKTFRFTGGEIVNEFLVSTGYLHGAHKESCPIYEKTLKAKPKWRVK